MRQLSDGSRKLIDSLRTTPGLTGFHFERPGWNVEAIEQLGRNGEPAASGSRLWNLFSESRLAHVRRNLLRLIAALPKWESIPYLLHVAHEREEDLAVLAREYVVRWDANFNRSQTVPSRDQLSRLEVALVEAEPDLPGSTVASIRFSITAFRSE